MSGRSLFTILGLLLVTISAEAAQRTFVSAGSGDDANDCSRSSPCRNFSRAMQQTDSEGEVIVLDSGGYGVVSINQSVSIVAPPGVYAGITAFSGNAITIAPTLNNAVVRLRGLTLNALGGSVGISHAGGGGASENRLYIESCTLSGFLNSGMMLTRNGSFYIHDSVARETTVGIHISGDSGFPSNASVRNVVLERGFRGLRVDNGNVSVSDSVATSNSDIAFWAFPATGMNARLSITDSLATHNGWGFYAGSTVGTGTARLFVSGSVATMNQNAGITADSNATVRVTHTTIHDNTTGLQQSGSGVFESRGDNNVRGNTTEKAGTITTYGPE